MARSEDRKITIRVDPGRFIELDTKRAAEQTSFQELGESWFTEWLEGKRGRSSPFPDDLTAREERILIGILALLRSQSDDLRVQRDQKIAEMLSRPI